MGPIFKTIDAVCFLMAEMADNIAERERARRKEELEELTEGLQGCILGQMEEKLLGMFARQGEEMEKRIQELTTKTVGRLQSAANQVESTTKSYADAIRTAPNQGHVISPADSPNSLAFQRMKAREAIKETQLLMDPVNEGAKTYYTKASSGIVNEFNTQLAVLWDASKGFKAVSVRKLDNGGLLFEMNSQEAVKDLDEIDDDLFARATAGRLKRSKRVFVLVIEYVSLSFDFTGNSAEDRIKELAETNNFDAADITSREWAKNPANRSEGQRSGHLIVKTTNRSLANKLILN
ncbi:hypothetical protein DL96DRAFT_1468932, partial [Flagelloscypha sp. PMI_526]